MGPVAGCRGDRAHDEHNAKGNKGRGGPELLCSHGCSWERGLEGCRGKKLALVPTLRAGTHWMAAPRHRKVVGWDQRAGHPVLRVASAGPP